MVVSRDVKTGLGFMLVSKGMVLTEKNIEWIKRYYDLDPSRKGIFVYSKRA